MLFASSLVSGLALGAIYALVATGLNLIFGVVKIINFAQGALLTLALYVVYVINVYGGITLYATLPITVLIMGGLGYLIQVALIGPVLNKERTSQLLITFGLAMVIENCLLAAWGPNLRSVTGSLGSRVWHVFSVPVTAANAIAFGGAVVTVAALWVFLKYTRTGTAIRAVAQHAESAELAGINTRQVFGLAFAVGMALCAIAATLMAPIYSIQPSAGDSFGIMAFIIVVLGGLGSVLGATLAAVVIAVGEDLFAVYVSPQMATAFVFLVFIVLMIMKPNGLFGRAGRVA